MKELLTNIVIVLITLVVAALISLLLSWPFIKEFVVRQLLVYLLMLLVLFIGFRILYLYNQNQ
jgi:hypothetical protein